MRACLVWAELQRRHGHSERSLGVPIKSDPCQDCNNSPAILSSCVHVRIHARTMCAQAHTHMRAADKPQTAGLMMMDGVHNLAGYIDFS